MPSVAPQSSSGFQQDHKRNIEQECVGGLFSQSLLLGHPQMAAQGERENLALGLTSDKRAVGQIEW